MSGLKLQPRKPAETIAEMTVKEIIDALPDLTLEALVEQLTGGQYPRSAVSHWARRIREDGVWLR